MNAPDEDRFSADLERLADAAPPVPGVEGVRRRHRRQQVRKRAAVTASVCLVLALLSLMPMLADDPVSDVAPPPVIAEAPQPVVPVAPLAQPTTPDEIAAAIQSILPAGIDGELRVAKGRSGLVVYGAHASLDDEHLDGIEALLDGVSRFDAVFTDSTPVRITTFLSKCI